MHAGSAQLSACGNIRQSVREGQQEVILPIMTIIVMPNSLS
jgi:hypothetical protein